MQSSYLRGDRKVASLSFFIIFAHIINNYSATTMTKYNIRLILFVITGLLATHVLAQSYSGVLIDKESKEPVDLATVVLLSNDSTAIAVVPSDQGGHFSLSGDGARWLQVSHILYESMRLELPNGFQDTIYLDQKSELLSELVVKAERPMMKLLEGGIPSYDIDVLFEKSTVTTAYEMLSKLPGMSMENGVPKLVGTNGYTLVINGKPSNIPQDQLLEMLKTIPVQMVANVDISYAPIAKYRAKGASINIVLKQQSKDKALSGLSGQLFGTYTNEYYSRYNAGGNITYSDASGFSVTGNYKAEWGSQYTDMTFDTQPFGTNSGFHINNHGRWSPTQSHTAFVDLSYAKEKHNISVNYYGNFSPNDRYIEQNRKNPDPLDRVQNSSDNTHHAALEYIYNDHLMAGAFYTNYNQRKDVQYGLERTPLPNRALSYSMDQRSQVIGVHVDNSHKLDSGWGVEYGSKFSFSNTINRQLHRVAQGKGLSEPAMEQTSRELLADAYVGVKKQFTPKLNMGLTLIGDYAKYFGHEENFQVIPQASLMYQISPEHILQFTLNSEKKYPAYYERESFTTIHSEYQQWQGNPDLRPYVSYKGQLVYILKSRYIFILGDTYNPNYFVQLMYLDPKINQIVYKTWNWNYSNSLSLATVLPLPQTSWWQGKLTMNGQFNSVKMDIPYEEALERHRFMFFASLTNDFVISEKHNLTAGLDASYITGGMQGLYTFDDIIGLDVRMKWMSQDKKWSVTLNGDDLLNRATPRIKVDYGIHKFEFVPATFGRSVSLDLRYTFGSFKSEKTPGQLNTDRFGM